MGVALRRTQYSCVWPRPFQIWLGRIGHRRGYFRASIADPFGKEASSEGRPYTAFHERNGPPGNARPRRLELYWSAREGVRQGAIGRGRARNASRLVQDRYTVRAEEILKEPEVDVPLVRYGQGGRHSESLGENLAPPSQRCEGVPHTGRRHAALLNFMHLMGRQARRLRLSGDRKRRILVWASEDRAAHRRERSPDFTVAGSIRERDHAIILGPHKSIAQICYSPMLGEFISGCLCSCERVISDSPSFPVEVESCWNGPISLDTSLEFASVLMLWRVTSRWPRAV